MKTLRGKGVFVNALEGKGFSRFFLRLYLRLFYRTRIQTMTHIPYPEALDIECASFVFKTLKDRTLGENKQKFAHCLWNLQGYLQKMVIGAEYTNDKFGCGNCTFSPTEEGVLNSVLVECKAITNEPFSMSDSDPIAGFDITSFISLIPILMQLLEALGIGFPKAAAERGVDRDQPDTRDPNQD